MTADTPPPGPRTAAGRALLADPNSIALIADNQIFGISEGDLEDAILAIEAEARAGLDVAADWTVDDTGHANSSPEFLRLVDEVERLIRADAHHLMNGRADFTACLIVAQLAHKQGLAPIAAAYGGRDGLREALETIERLKTALRVQSHSPHDEDGPVDQASGFKTCSGCGAILTGGRERDTSWSPIARPLDVGLLADVLAVYDIDPYTVASEYNRLAAQASPVLDWDSLPSGALPYGTDAPAPALEVEHGAEGNEGYCRCGYFVGHAEGAWARHLP